MTACVNQSTLSTGMWSHYTYNIWK